MARSTGSIRPFAMRYPPKDQCDQIHHALKEQVPAHEIAHTAVVIPLGEQERLIAPVKFFALNVFVCE